MLLGEGQFGGEICVEHWLFITLISNNYLCGLNFGMTQYMYRTIMFLYPLSGISGTLDSLSLTGIHLGREENLKVLYCIFITANNNVQIKQSTFSQTHISISTFG